MAQDDRSYLKAFYRELSNAPLDSDDPRYIPLYNADGLASEDPVERLARKIEWTGGESVQLLSGFRGTGKSTELRRLRRRLEQVGYLVFLCDIEDYLNLSLPVDVSDFLMAVVGLFGEAANQGGVDTHLPQTPIWERLGGLLKSAGEEFCASIKAGPITLKANLKSDPAFKQRLQKHMAGHLGTLVEEVHSFFTDSVKALKSSRGKGCEVVLLLDSVEHIRGTSVNAQAVQSSVETLFASHAERLRLPHVHVVYTVPPYLKARYANLGSLYEPGGIQLLPAFKLRGKDGEPLPNSYGVMEKLVSARGDWQRLLGDRHQLERLIRYSGGHLRDLLRLLAEVVVRAADLPVPEALVSSAIQQRRSEFLPVADDDARWLAAIAQSHGTALDSVDNLPTLARFFDTHLVLCYQNGDEWYDVHPLIAQQVFDQVEANVPPDGREG